MSDAYTCPKCGQTSGNDWSQCEKRCPFLESPHFDAKTAVAHGNPKRPTPRVWKKTGLRDF